MKKKIGNSFLFLSICVLIVEIVLSIVLTEEGNVLAPKKILYRYFQILEIPIFLIFLNGIEKLEFPKKMWAVYVSVLGILAVYFFYIGDGQRTAIIDAPVYLLMENVTRYVFPYFNILVCILAAGIVGMGAWLHSRKKWDTKVLLIAFKRLGIVCIVAFFVVNLLQLPYYSNTIADGRRIEEDSIKIANYLIEDETHSDIYFVTTESDRYERAVYAYLNENIIYVSREKIKHLSDKNAVVIVSSKCDLGENFQEIELSTEVLGIVKLK